LGTLDCCERHGLAASVLDWTAPEGSSLLALDASSIPSGRDGSRRIAWKIKGHPTKNRMARQADSIETL